MSGRWQRARSRSGLTGPYARFTPPAAEALRQIGLALAGRAGARLARALGLEVGRDTLLRRVRALPDPAVATVAVLGVDDFALRRGAFAEMLCERHGDRLGTWITTVEADDDLPDLHRFTHGLRRDRDAVLAGLTEPHSSGVVEGNVNRIKMIKRQMFGRAAFDLLRKRVLPAR